MLNFIYVDGKLTAVSAEYVANAVNRNDMQNMAHADEIAADATALTGRLHIPVDKGNSTFPRYDVIEAPVVGALVSRAFNGDSYPAGKVIKVSKSLRRVQTDDGTVFFRVRKTASWRANGTWFMSPGHTDKRNPSF